jgi:hypothetical protein
VYCDADTPADSGAAIGITKTAAITGSTVEYLIAGPMSDAGWAWTPGRPVFCGANGVLTQTAPATAFVQPVAVAETETTIIVQIQPSVNL